MARRRVFQRAAARRRTSWEGAQLNFTLTTGVQSQAAIVSEAILENVPNPTIVRIRGEVLVAVSASGAAGAVSEAVMGIKITTSSAFAAGGASVESPSTEIGGDWIWWHTAPLRNDAAFTAGNDEGLLWARVPIDSKAMRKVKVNEVLIFVVHNVAIASTHSQVISGGVRILLKL